MTTTTKSTEATKPRLAHERKPAAAGATRDTSSSDVEAATPAASRERAAQPPAAPNPQKPASKASAVLVMLQQPAGATLDQMVAATGWLPHTTRAALTGFKKKGHVVTSDKVDGVRTYRVAPAGGQPSTSPTAPRVVAES